MRVRVIGFNGWFRVGVRVRLLGLMVASKLFNEPARPTLVLTTFFRDCFDSNVVVSVMM